MFLPGDEIALRNLLKRNAELFPNREMFDFEHGEKWSAAQVLREVCAAADVLRRAGVEDGDVVSVMLPNGPDFIRAWWGATMAGAIFAPLNVAFKGNMLGHLLEVEQPKVIVTDPDHRPHFDGIEHGAIIIDPQELRSGDPAFPGTDKPASISDVHTLIATSGTTGRSKVWTTTMLQILNVGSQVEACGMDENDRFLVDLPLFHSAAIGTLLACQVHGVPISLRAKPSLSRYLEVIRETGATAAYLVGSMAAKLLGDPPGPDDRNHSLRTIAAAPLPPRIGEFCERFGIAQVTTGYGSTELGRVLVSDPASMPPPGSCGKRRPGWEHRLVDGQGHDVEVGQIGEMIVRPGHPALCASGYFRNPEATAEAWQEGWFHTGDLFREDEDGNFYYIDRTKDSVRRRGENISSYEVEMEVATYPGVATVACVGAPSDEGVEDEVKVWIELKPGVEIDFNDLAEYLESRMPRYMVPRYFELIDKFPMTATHRIQKHVLRERGNSASTWDRMKAIKREMRA